MTNILDDYKKKGIFIEQGIGSGYLLDKDTFDELQTESEVFVDMEYEGNLACAYLVDTDKYEFGDGNLPEGEQILDQQYFIMGVQSQDEIDSIIAEAEKELKNADGTYNVQHCGGIEIVNADWLDGIPKENITNLELDGDQLFVTYYGGTYLQEIVIWTNGHGSWGSPTKFVQPIDGDLHIG